MNDAVEYLLILMISKMDTVVKMGKYSEDLKFPEEEFILRDSDYIRTAIIMRIIHKLNTIISAS